MSLSDIELRALQTLEKRKDIIICSADKGGWVVVLSFDQCDKGIKSQLNDTQCYIPLNSNPTEQIKAEIDLYIESAHAKGWVTENEKAFLIGKHPICPVFHGLPRFTSYCIQNWLCDWTFIPISWLFFYREIFTHSTILFGWYNQWPQDNRFISMWWEYDFGNTWCKKFIYTYPAYCWFRSTLSLPKYQSDKLLMNFY